MGRKAPPEFPRTGTYLEDSILGKILPGDTPQYIGLLDIKVNIKLIDIDKTEEEIRKLEKLILDIE